MPGLAFTKTVMFGFSLTKLLFTIAAVIVAWNGFKWYTRMQENRAVGKSGRSEGKAAAPGPANSGGTVDAEEMGKNAGDDLAEGKATLPLIHALGECAPDQHQLLSSAISEGHRDWLIEVKAIIESTSALAYTSRRARDYAEAARQSLETLPASPYRTALADLADFSVSRTY